MMSRLERKVALVSGSARGTGAALVRAMAAEGAKVVVADVARDEGRKLADEIGPAATYVHLDVTKPADWSNAVDAAVQAFGRLDVLVNNAGVSTGLPTEPDSHADWEQTIAVDLTGVFNGIHAAIPALQDAGSGSIVNISPGAGKQEAPPMPARVAAKWGVRGLTKAAAVALSDDGIRVNSIHPSSVQVCLAGGGPTDLSLLHPTGEASELASLVVFLASDESSFCTGSDFIGDSDQISGSAARWSVQEPVAA
jgi:3alpha(or 20beta)-hydroxysteroid dehydrogenase